MATSDYNPPLSEPRRQSHRPAGRIEVALNALVFVIAGACFPIRHDQTGFEIYCRLWFALTILFLWMVGFRNLQNRSTALSAGELLGLGPVSYWLGLFGASCIEPEGGLIPALVFVVGTPLYFVTSLISCGFLLATVAGKRRDVPYNRIDFLGLFLNISAAALFLIELRLHPVL